jgi:hypothetical protein
LSDHACLVRLAWGSGRDATTVAKVVVTAFNSRRPKRRYHPNLDAASAILIKRLTGHILLDRIMPRMTSGV